MTRICVRAIILHQGKLLCVRLKQYDGAIVREEDFWCLPGGGVDKGEAIVPALAREMLEETGVTPQIGALLYVHQFAHKHKHFVEFFFHVTNAEDYLHIDLSKSSHGQDEIAEIAFVDPASTYILPAFLASAPLSQKIASSSPTEFMVSANE